MNLEKLKKRKKELRLTNKDVAELSGVSLGTVNKIFSGATKAPQVDTMKAILNVLRLEEYQFYDSGMEQEKPKMKRIIPDTAQNGHEPKVTAEEYRALPDRRQTELVEGRIVRHGAPAWNHQELISGVLCELREYIKSNGYRWHAVCGPVEVRLEGVDGDTVAQPDLVMLLGEEQISSRGLEGAPEFIMEVLAENEQEQELIVKPEVYMDAGVREYWVVNLYQRQVLSYWFGSSYGKKGFRLDTYTFEQEVPLRLLDGFTVEFGTFDLM